MTRTVGTTRMVVAGMALMGGALGVFGDVKLTGTNYTFPRVPRTEQEQTAHGQDEAMPSTLQGFALLARERSTQTDPCVPVAPVTFFARGPLIC